MTVIFNGNEIVFPSMLADISLGQFIKLYDQYGRDHDKQAAVIMAMPDGIEKDAAASLFRYEQMIQTSAFFLGISEDSITESDFVDQLASIYYTCSGMLNQEAAEQTIEYEFLWKGEFWVFNAPYTNTGGLKFNEIVEAKQILQKMIELGKNSWENLVPLSAIFLRREGEAYDPEFIVEDSDRQKMMLDLPLNIALQVGTHLSRLLEFSKDKFILDRLN